MTTTPSETDPVSLATELPPGMDAARLVFTILPSDLRQRVEIDVRRPTPDGRVRVEAVITPEQAGERTAPEQSTAPFLFRRR